MEALGVGEADVGAGLGLGRGLDALGHGLDQEVPGQRQERVQEAALRHRGLVEPGDEAAVELQVVGRGLRQLQQPRLPGPEVVVGQGDVALQEQRAQLRDCRGAGENALVDLQGEVELGSDLPKLLEGLQQPRPVQLDRVGVQEDRREILLLPGELVVSDVDDNHSKPE